MFFARTLSRKGSKTQSFSPALSRVAGDRVGQSWCIHFHGSLPFLFPIAGVSDFATHPMACCRKPIFSLPCAWQTGRCVVADYRGLKSIACLPRESPCRISPGAGRDKRSNPHL